MPRLIFQVSEREKELYVDAAHRERVSLSEWLRRAAGEREAKAVTGNPLAVEKIAPRVLSEHKTDSKNKAAQEHGKRQPKPTAGLCPHRVPDGSYCKRCEEGE